MAAAIAITWLDLTNQALVTRAFTVALGTGAATVSAQMVTSSQSKAIGNALDPTQAGTHVGAAVALNYVNAANTASIGRDAHLTAGSVTVEAVVPGDEKNTLLAWGLAAAGGKSDPQVAGSVALEVVSYTTSASIGKHAVVDSSGGVKVNASTPFTMQNLALAGAISQGGTVVGGAVVVAVLGTTTSATIDSGTAAGDVTTVHAGGALSVTASSSLEPSTPQTGVDKIDEHLPAVSSVALGGGAGTGDAAVTGSVVVNVVNVTTSATIAAGALVNTGATDVGGAGQTVTVSATDHTTLTNVAGALSLTTGSAGVALGLIVEVANQTVTASIGSSAQVNAGGAISLTAGSESDLFGLSIGGGVSTSGSGVAGSILVEVLNQGAGAGTRASIGSSAAVHAGSALTVNAHDDGDISLATGQIAIGSTAGVGAASTTLVRSMTVDAGVGSGANLRAGGTGLAVTGAENADLTLIAVGGAGGGDVGVAGSVVVDVLTDNVSGHLDDNTVIGSVSTPTSAVAVGATDTTSILALAGQITFGGTAGVGAGVDVEVIHKSTVASVGKHVVATVGGNVSVDATSSEKITSLSVGGGFGGTASVNVNAAVPVIDVTTVARIVDGTSSLDGAVIRADGSVRISANEALTLNVVAGNISASGTAAVGAAVAVPVVTKNTHAYIGNFTVLTALGNSTLPVVTGGYGVTPKDTRFNPQTPGVLSGTTVTLPYQHGLKTGDQVIYDVGAGMNNVGGVYEGTPIGGRWTATSTTSR